MTLPRAEASYAAALEGLYLPGRVALQGDLKIAFFNKALARDFQIEDEGGALRAVLRGQAEWPGAQPLAMAYAGHQFGGFSPVLGDGRALLLAELRGPGGVLFDLHLKGSGATPFARGGDGKAALGPMLREVLISEALAALGLPTSRALAVLTTGETLWRDQALRPGAQPGAVLARIAASHLRIGSFEFCAARGDRALGRRLLAFAVARHDPDLDPGDVWGFCRRVVARQAKLLAQWMALGFVHGVMNTDNMTLSGESLDFGPCAFLDAHDPGAVFSAIDRGGRYAYARQPAIAQWNLARLAEALLPLALPEDDRGEGAAGQAALAEAEAVVQSFAPLYAEAFAAESARKLALPAPDAALVEGFWALLVAARADHTQSFRALAPAAQGAEGAFLAHLPEGRAWLTAWRAALEKAPGGRAAAAQRLVQANPAIIPRNHLVEEALAAAEAGDLAPFEALLTRLQNPYEETAAPDPYTQAPPPGFGPFRSYCGT